MLLLSINARGERSEHRSVLLVGGILDHERSYLTTASTVGKHSSWMLLLIFTYVCSWGARCICAQVAFFWGTRIFSAHHGQISVAATKRRSAGRTLAAR